MSNKPGHDHQCEGKARHDEVLDGGRRRAPAGASSSFRAPCARPRSAVIAGCRRRRRDDDGGHARADLADSRRARRKPPRRSREPRRRWSGSWRPAGRARGRRIAEADGRDQQRETSTSRSAKEELRDELAAVGGRAGGRADTIVLPVRIIMSPNSSSTCRAGTNAPLGYAGAPSSAAPPRGRLSLVGGPLRDGPVRRQRQACRGAVVHGRGMP